MIKNPEFCVLVAPGTNCGDETLQVLSEVGAVAKKVHIGDLKSGAQELGGSQGLVIPGGFSYGDIIRAGAIFASDLRASYDDSGSQNFRVVDQVNEFAAAGKPIIGTCNGAQVLVESGLLPHGRIDPADAHLFTLDGNQNTKFESRWTKLRVEENSLCPFIPEEDEGTVIELPVAHAEGRFLAKDGNYEALIKSGQVVLRFCDAEGQPTETYPDNPNGSPYGITGLCSPSGTVFGMMPHDERFSRREHHPNWRRQEVVIPDNFLAKILNNAVSYAKEM